MHTYTIGRHIQEIRGKRELETKFDGRVITTMPKVLGSVCSSQRKQQNKAKRKKEVNLFLPSGLYKLRLF